MYVLHILHGQASHFHFLISFSSLFNVSNAFDSSGIKFYIWGSLYEIVSVPSFTVRLCEDCSA